MIARKKIVIIGDSISDCGRAKPIGEGLFGALGRGYISLFDAMAQVDHPEWRLRVVNMGIDGNTSRDLLVRWESDVNALHPDITAVLIGINDVWRQFDSPFQSESQVLPDEYAENLRQIAHQQTQNAYQMLFLSPFFLEPNPEDPMRVCMDVYRSIMRTIAEESGIPFVDLQEAFARVLQNFYPGYLTWDRVHPNEVGQLVIARQLMQMMESIMQ